MENQVFTYQDYTDGLCKPAQIGTHKVPNTSPPLPPSSQELIQTYIEVFHDIGGKAALIKQAQMNPMKFYDQLLKLLIAMEAPQAQMAIQMNFGPLSDQELEALPTIELKRRLMGEG